MYHFLHGRIVDLSPGLIVLDVAGIGFEISVPLSDHHQIQRGADVVLWTHLALKEDALQLYGFFDKVQRDLFRRLLKVTGIGPRMSLQILSSLQPQELIQVMVAEDWKRLTMIPGIGPKTARRLLIELKEKLTDQELLSLPSGSGYAQPLLSQAFFALSNLGFSSDAIRLALKAFSPEDAAGADLETIIRRALAKLSP